MNIVHYDSKSKKVDQDKEGNMEDLISVLVESGAKVYALTALKPLILGFASERVHLQVAMVN